MSLDGNPTVLVVDDVDANVRLLEAMLAPHGYDVLTAGDGEAAMELAESARPDLILLDVVMPGPDDSRSVDGSAPERRRPCCPWSC